MMPKDARKKETHVVTFGKQAHFNGKLKFRETLLMQGTFKGTIEASGALIVDKDACMECGACALNCPANALEVNAGVGCAAAIIMGWVTGEEPSCDCSGGGGCC